MKHEISWLTKYMPKKISDIVGNAKQINEFDHWLCDNNKKKYSIIISGNHGIGKTSIIKLVLAKYNFNIKYILPNDIKDYKYFNNLIEIFNVNNHINKILLNRKYISNVIIFNDIENITLINEKKFIIELYKKNNKTKNYLLIFITNNTHSKLLHELKKELKYIYFDYPTYEELYKHVIGIYNNEQIEIEDNNSIKDIIEFSQYDIRRLVIILQELTCHIKDNLLTKKNINNYISISNNKNINIGLYKSIKYIFENHNEHNNIYKLYQYEKVLLPLMVYENYLNKIDINIDMKDKLTNIYNIINSLSIGDNIETSIYTDQHWDYQKIHGFYSCINPVHYTNYNINIESIRFAKDLNKTSLKNINKKNITNLIKITNINDINELLLLNDLCSKLLFNKNIKNFNILIEKYKKNMIPNDIELFFKINKII